MTAAADNTTGRRMAIIQRAAIVVGLLVVTGGVVLLTALQPDQVAANATGLAAVCLFATVAWFGVRDDPRNPLVWILTLWVLCIGFYPIVPLTRLLFYPEVPVDLDFETYIPADLPAGAAWTDAMYTGLASLSFTALLTFGFLLFPDGRLPSPRWRWVGRLFAACLVGMAVINVIVALPSSTVTPTAHPLFHLTTPFVLGAPFVSIAGLIVKYRGGDREMRGRIRWVFLGALLAVPILLIGVVFSSDLLTNLGLGIIVVSYGIAIVRHRLFDVDVVISKTLVFAGLVGFITLVYAALVVGVGSVVGGSSLGWSIAATAIVAVVFEPVRDRVQRWVNRLVYGQRATPYEVLADLTGRLARTEREEGLFERMAERVAEGTGADRVVVWTAVPGGLAAVASQPEDARPGEMERSMTDLPGVAVPVEQDGEVLGALTVETGRGEALTATERRLIEDLTGSVGLMMRRRRLDEELKHKAVELAESRRRLVGAQDEERRHLEQELNRGAQQQVLALRLELDLAERTARSEGLEQVAGLLAQMSIEAQDAIEQIRALAHGIYPPLLEAEGLTVAVAALAEIAPVDVDLHDRLSGRHPLPLEAAVYFCVSEALTNAVKHGHAPMSVQLSDAGGELRFEVSDSGPGFDPGTVTRGSGLNNLNDRLDALDGSVVVDSTLGRSTVIRGRLPLGVLASAPT